MPDKSHSKICTYRAAFHFGDLVIVKTDPDSFPRIVVSHMIDITGSVQYFAKLETTVAAFYEEELILVTEEYNHE